MKQIVILGGGYAGLLCALTVRKFVYDNEAVVTLINRSSSHQLITELHRLAAGNLPEQAVALSLTKLLKGKRVQLVTEEVTGIDTEQREVRTSGGDYSYDYLVIAMGSQTAYYGIPGLEKHSLPLKSIHEANRINMHIQESLARYKQSRRPADVTIVVGGGGLSGIEMLGEIADMLPKWCDEHGIQREDIKLYGIEASPSILPGFPAELAVRAQSSLERRGAKFMVGVPIAAYDYPVVLLKNGQSIATHTLIWTGGIQGNPIVADSAIDTLRGRAVVNDYLQSTSHHNIFVAGDSAICYLDNGQPLPPSAQLAWQMGEAVGYNLFAMINGMPLQPFKPVIYGKLASLGRKDAVATLGKHDRPLKGLPASLMKEASKAKYLTHIRGLQAYLH